MKQKLLSRRPSPAMVVALVALVSSLTGVAVGATLITGADVKNGSIGTKDLKNGGVTAKDLKRNSVRTKKVKNGSLLAQDFAPGEFPGTGPTGPEGPKGDDGAPGVANLQRVSDITATNSDSPKSIRLACPDGKRVLGAGAELGGAKSGTDPNELSEVVIDDIVPNTALTEVTVDAYETDATADAWDLTIYVICANVG